MRVPHLVSRMREPLVYIVVDQVAAFPTRGKRKIVAPRTSERSAANDVVDDAAGRVSESGVRRVDVVGLVAAHEIDPACMQVFMRLVPGLAPEPEGSLVLFHRVS